MAARFWVGGSATWDGTAGAKWATTSGGAGGAAAPTAADTVTFDANSGASTVTIGTGAVALSMTCSAFTGTFAFGTNSISLAGNAATVFSGSTTYSVTGTPLINLTYSGATGTRTISPAVVTEANAISFNITGGSDIVTLTSTHVVKNLTFSGFTGTLSAAAKTIYGNLTLSSGMTVADSSGVHTFAATSGTQTITTNGVTVGGNITISGGATIQLQDALTMTALRNVTLTLGTLDLNNKNLTVGIFSSTNTNVRSVLFGTGQIYLTGSATTIYNTGTGTNLTYTGTPVFNLTYSGSTGTRTISAPSTTPSISNAATVNVVAGSDIVSFGTAPRSVLNVDFTGFSGTCTELPKLIYGNLILSTGMTTGAFTTPIYFAANSGTKTITTNGKTIDGAVQFIDLATWQLQDDLNVGSTRTVTLATGTLNLNNNKLTTGYFNSNNSNTRSLLFGASGSIDVTATGTAWDVTTSTNFTTSGAGSIKMSSSSTKTFAGGGGSYPTLIQGGAGALTISGNNTFHNITNTVQPTTVLFTASSNTTFNSFTLNGTSGNLVTIRSTTPGQKFYFTRVLA